MSKMGDAYLEQQEAAAEESINEQVAQEEAAEAAAQIPDPND
jgi:hypothetical protein